MENNNLGKKPSFASRIKNIVKNLVPKFILLQRDTYLLRKQQKKRSKPRTLLRFEVHLADHCNLNCRGCDHFSPIAKEKFVDVEHFKRDCARISELTNGKIAEIQLLGGEPLLHPQIIDLIHITGKNFRVGKKKIVTNGMLLLKQPDVFWQSCKKNDIQVVITNYPIRLDHEKIRKTAKRHGVKLGYMGGDHKTLYAWKFDENGNQNMANSFAQCFKANTCIHLKDGKLYTCPTIPCIEHLNNYFNKRFQITENDYIDIYKVKTINEIFDFLCKPVPFCRYCDIAHIKNDVEWAVSRKDISEWNL
jgi:hypothetical protein